MVYRAALDRLDITKKALREIAKARGPFSRDQYEFACNTIEAMKVLAAEALLAIATTDAWDNSGSDGRGVPMPPTMADIDLMMRPAFDLGRLDDKFMGLKVRLDDKMPKGTLRCYNSDGRLLGEITGIGE